MRTGISLRRLTGGFVVVALLGVAPPAAAQDLDALLRRLSEHWARMKTLTQAGVTMATTSEQLDGKGKVESRSESVERRFSDNGVETIELRRFVRDGKDTLAEEKVRREKSQAKAKPKEESDSRSFRVSSPFAPDAQPRHRFTLVGPDPQERGLVRVKFEPRGPASPDLVVGEAAVDPAAGTVRWIKFHPSKNPKHVTRMDVEMTYGLDAPGGPALSRLTVSGEGGLLFIKKGYRSESTFSDYGGGAGR